LPLSWDKKEETSNESREEIKARLLKRFGSTIKKKNDK